MEMPFDPAIPLLGLYPKNPESPIQKNLCTPMFIAAQLTILLKRKNIMPSRKFFCWDYTLRALIHQSKRTYAPQCSSQHNVQEPGAGSNVSAHL